MPFIKLARCATLVCAALFLSAPAVAESKTIAPGDEGETWEATVQMTMQGMSMPPQTSKVCHPKNADAAPPMPEDGNCEMKDVKVAAGRVSWRVECKAPEATKGTGEIVYSGRESYSGTMTMSSSMGEMVMKLSGRRLGEPCDAGALKRQAAAAQATAQQGLANFCRDSAANLNPYAFAGGTPQCADPADKEAFCRKARSQEGYAQLGGSGSGTLLKEAGTVCGFDPEATRKDLCASALKSESLDFLGKNCPDETRTLAQRECAGRKYTALAGSKYQGFCTSYAAEMLAGAAPSESAGTEPKDAKSETLKKAKKKLTSLLGR